MTSNTLPETKRTNPTLKDALRLVKGSDLIGLDIETSGLNPRTGRIRLVQVSDGKKTFVIDCNYVDPERLIEALAEVKTLVAHGADFEWRWIYHHFGVTLDNLKDTMLMSQILACGNTALQHGLGPVTARELELALDKKMQVSDWTAEPLSKRQLNYAAYDAYVLPTLYAKVAGQIAKEGLERVADIEHSALPAVARMKLEGMPVDREAWNAHAEALAADLRALEQDMLEDPDLPERPPIEQSWGLKGDDCLAMLHAAGLEAKGTTAKDLEPFKDHELVKRLLIARSLKGEDYENAKAAVHEIAPIKPPKPAPPWNFGSPQQVHEITYELLGFYLDSTDEGTLLRYVNQHRFFKQLLRYRKLKKQVSTYGKGWFKTAYDEKRGRVHPGWQQIGTATGRFAAREPNAQNLPNGGPYRSFFKAPPGRAFVDIDYSQIEIRIMAKLLGVQVLLKLYAQDPTADVYRATAATLLGIEPDEVDKPQRQLAKAIMLGRVYGLSAYGLPAYAFKNFGIEDMAEEDAEAYVRAFYDLYPEIEDNHASTAYSIRYNGSVDKRTMTGRLRSGIIVRNEGINAPVQGTAADGLKAAMRLVYERLRKFEGSAFIIATIHDELIIECDEADAPEIAEIVKTAMLEAMDKVVNAEGVPVPILVTGGVTRVWIKD